MGGEGDEDLEGQDLQGAENLDVETPESLDEVSVQPGEGDQGGPPVEGQERPLNRAERRYQSIIAENRRIKEDAERYRQEAEQYRQQQYAQQQRQDSPEVIEQRINQIEDPEQRINARLQWEQSKNRQQIYNMQLQMYNQQDQAQLGQILDKVPDAKKYSQQVEQFFNAQPQYLGGYKFSRQEILQQLLGKERLDNALKGKEKAAAQQRVAGQRVAPTSARGNVSASSGNPRDPVAQARARLERGAGGRPVVFD